MRPSDRQATREISYAHSVRSRGGRAFVRGVENATGRLGLIRRAAGYEDEVRQGRDFWQVMVERYGLTLDVVGGSLENLPKEGPLVVISNHPYGILDGLMMGHILSIARGDFRILAHQVFRKASELDRVILPISFDETKEAMRQNLETRAEALRYLGDGGAIGVFPGGTVSTAARPFGRAMDPGWRKFTAKMVAKSGATVVPIFFDGANSRLFQLASHIHSTLRLALLIKEFRARIDTPVRVVVGEALPADRVQDLRGDATAMMRYLRAETYRLSPRPIPVQEHGFDFEQRTRKP